MFKEIFETMNEVLDDLIREYSATPVEDAASLDEQLTMLKAMSDTCLEEWLRFEDKLAKCKIQLDTPPKLPESVSVPTVSTDSSGGGPASEHFIRGQGYYKLFMFRSAVQEFTELVRQHPDFALGRIYLAMGYLRMGELAEAYRHFQLLVPLTDNAKLKAISYNAMGCIQVHNQNMDKAYDYFKMADMTDSSCMEPALWSKEFWPFVRQ